MCTYCEVFLWWKIGLKAVVDEVATPCVTAVGNTWSEREATRVLTIVLKTESKILTTWKHKRAVKRTSINLTTVIGFPYMNNCFYCNYSSEYYLENCIVVDKFKLNICSGIRSRFALTIWKELNQGPLHFNKILLSQMWWTIRTKPN